MDDKQQEQATSAVSEMTPPVSTPPGTSTSVTTPVTTTQTYQKKSRSACLIIPVVFFIILAGTLAIGFVGFYFSNRLAMHADQYPTVIPTPISTPTPTIAYPSPQACQPLGKVSAPALSLSTNSPGYHKNYYPSFYNIYGWTSNDLQQQINQCGFKNDEGSFAGVATNHFTWKYLYDYKNNGTCNAKNVAVGAQVVIFYPKWIKPADSPKWTTNWFNKYISGLEIHENIHKDHYLDAGQKFYQEISSLPDQPTCQTLDKQVRAIYDRDMANLSALDKRYDAVTEHGLHQENWK